MLSWSTKEIPLLFNLPKSLENITTRLYLYHQRMRKLDDDYSKKAMVDTPMLKKIKVI